jgi:uncharacterized damage-inducible protein DinB
MTDLESLAVRSEPDFLMAGERPMLRAWLDYHRATLAWKCSGLSDEQLRERSVPPSSMSLIGLVRHMTEVELGWFQHTFLGIEPAWPYETEDKPDGAFDDVETADVAGDVQRFQAACETARAAEAGAESLDVVGQHRHGAVTLRWILVHMIEEYARHNGHADLIRERIDGAVGD